MPMLAILAAGVTGVAAAAAGFEYVRRVTRDHFAAERWRCPRCETVVPGNVTALLHPPRCPRDGTEMEQLLGVESAET